MKKILVIGSPGAGKSVFSRELNRVTNIPLIHLDCVFWKENWEHLSSDEMNEEVSKLLKNDSFIIDGNYFRTMEMRIKEADTIFFLDIDKDTCIKSVKERTGKKRPDLPSFLEEHDDPEFIEFIKDFHDNRKYTIYEYIEKYKEKNFIVLKSRDEMKNYIDELENKKAA